MAKNLRLTDTVTIANGAQESSTLSLQGGRIPLAILIPAAFTGTAVTFKGSADDVTYSQIYNEGTAYSVAVGASRYVALNRQAFEGVKHFRVVSGSAEGASRSIVVVNGDPS